MSTTTPSDLDTRLAAADQAVAQATNARRVLVMERDWYRRNANRIATTTLDLLVETATITPEQLDIVREQAVQQVRREHPLDVPDAQPSDGSPALPEVPVEAVTSTPQSAGDQPHQDYDDSSWAGTMPA